MSDKGSVPVSDLDRLDRLAEMEESLRKSATGPTALLAGCMLPVPVAPELIAVARAAAMRAAQKAEDMYGVEEVMDVERANAALNAKLREVFCEQ